MKKCVVLLSGGLDSRLAVRIMQERGYEVTTLFFKLPFGTGCCDENCSFNFSQMQGVKLKVFDCTKGNLFQEYLDVVRNPKFGRGTCMNPCIDCRIFIFSMAKEFADEKGIEIIATGEVEGERPMSQHRKAMDIIEEESGLNWRLVRPLCEIGIRGRSRKKQIELAKKFGISYPNPAGGCLLCEKEYCEKLKNILGKKLDYEDIKLLNIGRHFENSDVILGRNKKENDLLNKFAGVKINPKEPGPTALVRNKKYEDKARELIKKYSKKKIEGFEISQ